MDEHGSRSDQPMHQHLSGCNEFQYLIGLYKLPDIDNNENHVNADSFIYESVLENSKVLTFSDDWLTLAYMEPLLAKKHNAKINHGSKAMKSLNLF